MKGQRLISILSVGLSLILMTSSAPLVEASRVGARPSLAGEQSSGDEKRGQRHAGRENSAAAVSERVEEQAQEQARALSVPVEASPSGAAQPHASKSERTAPTASGGAFAASTFVVNSRGDGADLDTTDNVCLTAGGVCTLRAAIQSANATSGVSTINFNIPGSGVQTIDVGSSGLGDLPQIGSVIIDGYSQPGASQNTQLLSSNAVILIELNGTNAGTGGLGLELAGGNSIIKGLAINRFKGSGIQILSGEGNKVEGCFIGTNTDGTADLGNTQVGIFITFSNNNLIGGETLEERNVISGNDLDGIQISNGSSGNKVLRNLIGTAANGRDDLGNKSAGVAIFNSDTNIIGGDEPLRNVISGNDTHGVQIVGISPGGLSHNRVRGNFIGTDRDGLAALGNSQVGVVIFNSNFNTIGGLENADDGNIISGNKLHGVQISGDSTQNFVTGNLIGTDVLGTADVGNAQVGVAIFSSDNVVGGTDAGDRNVISGNDLHGVAISNGASLNHVLGNFIGLDKNGTADLGNSQEGVAIFESPNNLIGGEPTPSTISRNIISGNGLGGVLISGSASTGNRVEENFIGTDVTGALDRGNSQEGVAIFSGANSNVIGGPSLTMRNIIAGNDDEGIEIDGTGGTGGGSTSNRIENNIIGLSLLRNDLPNRLGGIRIDGASNNIIGGSAISLANNISRNSFVGVEINGSGATGNKVLGNLIAGPATPGSESGVLIRNGASGNFIGGPTAKDANNITGHSDGVVIVGEGTNGNKVQGNTIRKNANDGVAIRSRASDNTIGGTGAGEGNAISENTSDGVELTGAATVNKVQGNNIFSNKSDGVEVSGAGTTGNKVQGNTIRLNQLDGVLIENGAADNSIGGTGAGEGNQIRENTSDGVEVRGAGTTGNAILSNSIHSNGELGIDLDPVDGVNPNDAGDGDTGPNNKQNFPILNAPANLFGFTVITGTLNSTGATKFRIEFFSSPTCDPSNHGEGQNLIGALNDVTTDSDGNRAFDLSLPTLPAGHFVTATATNTSLPPAPQNTLNNTSEFSRCVEVPSGGALGVNTTQDTDDGACNADNCSLREAIRAANDSPGADTINFASGVAGQINLTSALPDLASDITINGPGASLLTVQRSTGGGYRVFHVLGGHTVTLLGLTISGGRPDGNADGGGVLNDGGVLTIANSVVSGNSTNVGAGGGIANRGGTLNVTNSTVSDNTAGSGGGIFNSANGTATITNSTVSRNTASGNRGGGIFNLQSSLTLQRSTVSDNSTAASDGNDPGGGGVHNDGGTLVLTRSTFSDNSTAGRGGGVHNVSGTANLRSSIVANNSAGLSGPDLSGSFNSQDFNLFESASGATLSGATTNNLTGVDPRLAPLADNGGPTRTHALQAESPAIDRGDCSGSDTDQRGLPCPFDDPNVANAGDGADVGAFEAQAAFPPTPTVLQFAQANHVVTEDSVSVSINVTRSGNASTAVSVDYATSDGTASERSDYSTALGTLRFTPGETSKTFDVLVNEDSFAEGGETVNLTLSNPTGGASLGAQATATLQITDDATEPPDNVIDEPAQFAAQHYHDLLNRRPDPAGHLFWTNEITSCGTDAGCISERRESVSAAFFLSIEFQQTGFKVIHIYKSTFADSPERPRGLPRYQEFLRDTREIGRDVVVGVGDWEGKLAANVLAFAGAWVQRADVLAQYPANMTAAQFVDKLFLNSEVTPTESERNAALAAFGAGGVEGRAAALLSVTESASVYNRGFNCAFVLMQYFGYLRRNPTDAPDGNFVGFDFWLDKLDSFSESGEDVRDVNTALGRVRRAEMLRAFLTSAEYRGRFGPASQPGSSLSP